MGLFCLIYGPQRFLLDFLRVNDETKLGLTGAQYACIITTAAGIWILIWKRRQTAELVVEETKELAEKRAAQVEALGASDVSPAES
jgi:prolipoprotein diacylglyceryltransferase